ncbi:hypothetical protein BJ165DRAFT_1405468 [Panaeolus papilionaceus]|nr:hypothetical protein BJ165DRAFT_1405468 [Panaeolus papilionaceus]
MSARSIDVSVPICGSSVTAVMDNDGRNHRNKVTGTRIVRNHPQRNCHPELLSKIFSRLCDSWSLASLAEDTTESVKGFTHVCRHWRAVALSTPNLWTYIDLTRPKWAELVRKRSQLHDLPISVKVPPNMNVAAEDTLVKIVVRPERVRDFSVSLQNNVESLEALVEGFGTISVTPLRALETLFFLGIAPRPISFEDMLANGAPGLKRLEFGDFTLPWTCPFLSNLTILNLTACDIV